MGANDETREQTVAELSSRFKNLELSVRDAIVDISSRKANVSADVVLCSWLSSVETYLHGVERNVGELVGAMSFARSRNFAVPAVPPPA